MPSAAHRPKLSDILAAEIAGEFFRNISVDMDFTHTPRHRCPTSDGGSADRHHIDQLIQLSKQLQRDLGRQDDRSADVHDVGIHRTRTNRGENRPSGTTHRAFRVPPLFLNDEHIEHRYAVDLVAEAFAVANGGGVGGVDRPSAHAPRPTGTTTRRLCAVEPDTAQRGTKSARSAKSDLSTRTHLPRVYPPKHSCVSLNAKCQRPALILRQTKSARSVRTTSLDFSAVHPGMQVEAVEGTLFPRRVERERPVDRVEPRKDASGQAVVVAEDNVQLAPEPVELQASIEANGNKGELGNGQALLSTRLARENPVSVLDRPTQTSPVRTLEATDGEDISM